MLQQLSTDHSFVEEQVLAGQITADAGGDLADAELHYAGDRAAERTWSRMCRDIGRRRGICTCWRPMD